MRPRALAWLSLFTSLGTLLCCALPSLLVLLGFGATVASVVSSQTWLVTLSRRKGYVFAVTATLLAVTWSYVTLVAPRIAARQGACPPEALEACATMDRFTRATLWIASGIYAAGFTVAYLLAPALRLLEP